MPSTTPLLATTAGHLVGDPHELLPGLGVEPQIVGEGFHAASIGRLASALSDSPATRPARKARSPAAAIMAALSVESASGGMKTGSPSAAPRARRVLAQPAVRRHAPGDAHRLRPVGARGVEQPVEQGFDDHPLKAGAEVHDVGGRQGLVGAESQQGTAPLQMAHDRGLQAAEAEIAAPGQVRSVAVGMGQPRARQRHAAVVALVCQPIDDGTARDTRGPAAWPPCRRPHPRRRRACGPAARTRRRGARDRGWYVRPRPRARRPAAASRRHRGPATRRGRPGDAPGPAARPRAQASVFAKLSPTSRDPTRPGPCVTAMAS